MEVLADRAHIGREGSFGFAQPRGFGQMLIMTRHMLRRGSSVRQMKALTVAFHEPYP